MKTLLKIIVPLIILLSLFLLSKKQETEIRIPREEIWPVMGTVASLRTPSTEREHFAEMLKIAKDTFEEVNTKLSVYRTESELSRLNMNGQLENPSKLTISFLQQTLRLSNQTQGLFDPTLLPVIQLWGFSGGDIPDPLPSPEDISQALNKSGLTGLRIETNNIHFVGMNRHIDSGGIAKGFALDSAYDKILARFPESPFLLNLGGEIRVHGQAEPNRPWKIGVQHPFEKGEYLGVVSIPSGSAISTSGHYERYFERDGIRYAHIIDPKTGHPVTGTAGVTVICRNATEADVLSTALFVAGVDGAAELLSTFPDANALLIPDTAPLQIFVSHGMQKQYTPPPEMEKVQRIPTLLDTSYSK